MKYALLEPCDQTICYFTPSGALTTKHGEALLLGTLEEVGDKLREWKLTADNVESVPDEAEFRSREDTW